MVEGWGERVVREGAQTVGESEKSEGVRWEGGGGEKSEERRGGLEERGGEEIGVWGEIGGEEGGGWKEKEREDGGGGEAGEVRMDEGEEVVMEEGEEVVMEEGEEVVMEGGEEGRVGEVGGEGRGGEDSSTMPSPDTHKSGTKELNSGKKLIKKGLFLFFFPFPFFVDE